MKSKPFLIFVSICFLAFLLANFYFLNRSSKVNLRHEFNGAVEDVRYDTKGTPYVTIGQTTYYLSASWDFKHLIEKGDTLQKRAGDLKVTLIKKNNKIFTFTP